MSVKFQDYYATLGVPRTASEEEIRRAYRKLARKHHPDVDKTPGATQRFAQIGEAYEVLKDKKKRERYDTLGERWKDGQEFTPPPEWQEFRFDRSEPGEGFDFGGTNGFSSFFEAFFGGAGGDAFGDLREQQRGPRSGRRASGGAPGFDGAFGGARRRAPHSSGGRSLEAALAIDLEDAYRGATQTITLDPSGGRGAKPRTYDVKIPPGTTHGTTIRLRGQGASGSGGAPAGDLLLRIEIKPHPRFTVSDHDLATTLPIAPWEAALGSRVPLRALDGSELLLSVPAGSSSGKRLRMRGMGLPRTGAERGDLIVELRIVVPEQPSDAERKAFEELARASKFDPREN